MRPRLPRAVLAVLALTVALVVAPPAKAIFHTFGIVELFSTADSGVQFIELRENFNAPGQHVWAGLTITSTNAAGTVTRTFTFPSNLPSSATSGRSVLIATASFAGVPGAVTPDYTLPAAQFPQGFLFPEGGTVNFASSTSVVTYGPLPTNGQSSVSNTGAAGVNSPRNFAGQQGSVNVQPTGVCCVGASCSVTTQAACGGAWTGGGGCTVNPCQAPTGPCCAASGVCTTTTQAACGGAWSASGSCQPNNPCPQPVTGLCCRGSVCQVATPAECTGANTAYVNPGPACNAGSNTIPCCKADFNKAGNVELLDIFAFLNAWFTNNAIADFNGAAGVDLLDIFAFLSAWFAGPC